MSLSEYIKRFKGSSFAKNSLTLSGGVAVAQVLPLLFYPVLGRIFTAEEFGLLAAVSSITTVLSVLGSGKYENGILVASDKREAAHLAVLSVVLGLVSMALSWVVLRFVLADSLVAWFQEQELARWLFVCPLAAFFIIVYNVYNEWCVREKYFKALSVNKIVNAGAITLGKLFFGFVRLSSQGLVVGDLIGRGISAVGCSIRAWLRDGSTFAQVRLSGLKRCAVRFSEFPLYTMPGQLLNTIGQALPVLFIAHFFNKAEVGYFSMALTLFAIPINVVGSAVRDVYRQRANEEYMSGGTCLASFNKVMKILLAVGIGAFLLFEWFLPQLMALFLGQQWFVAGRYAQILAPAMVLMFVSTSLSGLFIVAGKLRQFFYWQLAYAVTTFLSVWLGGLLFDSMEALLILFSVTRCAVYAASIVMTRSYAKGRTGRDRSDTTVA